MNDRKGYIRIYTAITLILCVLIGHSRSTDAQASQYKTSSQNLGCEWLIAYGKLSASIGMFPVLPGNGWDNLRNLEMSPVVDLALTDCTISVDGLYVIPNQVAVYPVKESHVSLMSNVIEHYENYTSSTSRSINVGGGGSFFGGLFGAHGKYSEEFLEVKKTALYSRTQIGRTEQRYNLYVARLVPDFRLSEGFKNRLMDIGNALMKNQAAMARYLSDLLVRDFGTHVVTSLNAGAMIEKLDYFKRDSLSTAVYTTNKVTQCMSVDFLSVFSAEESTTFAVSTEELKGYRNSVQKTTVNAYGGKTIGGAKIDLAKWESGLKENLVAIDRIGDLIHTTISHRSLPKMPKPYLKVISDSVKDAVMRYYAMNEVKGCQDPDSPNFEPLANVPGSCIAPLTNYSFGGVYQTCQEPESFGLCGEQHSPMQVNYLTGGYSCPDGYEPILLMSFYGIEQEQNDRVIFYGWTIVSTYWCAARRDSKLPSQSGALYGGAFSPRYKNPATDDFSCSPFYLPYKIGLDITLCLSADMTNAPKTRIPLGGFFTCAAGNPLAEPGRPVVSSAAHSSRSRRSPSQPPLPQPAPGPKRCPEGFTQAALDVFSGCEIMQCARLGSTGERQGGQARRPPYEEAPGEPADIGVAEKIAPEVNLTSASTTFQNISNPQFNSSGFPDAVPDGGFPSGTSVLSIVTVACIALVAVGIVAAVVFPIVIVIRRRGGHRGVYVEAEPAADSTTDRQPLLNTQSTV